MHFETGHDFRDSPVIYCKGSGMKIKAGVSFGSKSSNSDRSMETVIFR
jgi:hypothetical protein